jgi:hypothetical protein
MKKPSFIKRRANKQLRLMAFFCAVIRDSMLKSRRKEANKTSSTIKMKGSANENLKTRI